MNAGAVSPVRRSMLRGYHAFPEHPLKSTVTGLLHQRPFQRADLPSLVSSLTLMPSRWQATLRGCEQHEPVGSALYASAPEQYDADYRQLTQLCEFFNVPAPPHGETFFVTNLGACKLRWERHTEAQTYTFSRLATEEETQQPFAESSVALSVIPKKWLEELPGLVLAGVHVAMLETAPDDFAEIKPHFHRDGVVTGCSVDLGRFRVYSDWRTHSDGLGRILVHGMPDEAPHKHTAAGKVLNRVLELDKYRALALLALPFAQKLAPRIDQLNEELIDVTRAMLRTRAAEEEGHGGGEGGGARGAESEDELASQQLLLDRLCTLSAEGNKLSSSSSFRFAASAAYAKVVSDRIAFLQMERIEGLPSMETFLGQALHPAVRTCDAVAARLERLRTEMAHTADLLRTSLTVQQQAQNIRELEALQANSRTQLLLQESVEGLSVVAITYYSTGVIGYVLKAADKFHLLPDSLPVEIALGMSVPVIGVAVFVGLHRLKASVHAGAGGTKH